MKINQITSIIIEECIYIHRRLGPGLFESVYEEILEHRFRKRNLNYQRQKPIPVIFEEQKMEVGFRSDFIVEQKVLLELKSLELIPPVARLQMQTYLRLTGIQIGLLINFNVPTLKEGIIRFANNFVEE